MKFVTDENFRAAVRDGVQLRIPNLDLVRAEDVGLRSTDDRLILEWAAAEGRIVLTHDERTLVGFAWDRVERGEPMPGVIFVAWRVPVGSAIGRIVEVIRNTPESGFRDTVRFA